MDYFFSFLSPATYGLNGLDIVIFCIFVFYAYEGYMLGFIASFFDLLSFVLAFLFALKTYAFFGSAITSVFLLPQGFGYAIGFFLSALVSEIVLSILLRRLHARIPQLSPASLPASFRQTEKVLGIIPGLLSACIILAFLFSVVLALPTSAYLKRLVTTSRVASPLVSSASLFERNMQGIFGGVLKESLTFLSVGPKSGETVNLHFTVVKGEVDVSSEEEMLEALNDERVSRGLTPVVMDEELRDLARYYSNDMFSKGYFSHTSKDGLSPFDRMERVGIPFVHAGENLALAPSVELAMQGLMNSPGHRANMLSDKFGRVGIGVIDGGIYGKMFTQEFTD